MGITIHYRGKARSEQSLMKLIDAASHFAADRSWPFQLVDVPDMYLFRWDQEREDVVEVHGRVRGVIITPHPDSETVNLLFLDDLTLESFTKTQFANFETHVGVLDLLGATGMHMSELEIHDEAGLWGGGDPVEARARFGALGDLINEIGDQLRSEGFMTEGPNVPIDEPRGDAELGGGDAGGDE